MTQRTTVRQLEAEFADAMTRMYAVGNGLARLRAELDEKPVEPAAAFRPPTSTTARMPSSPSRVPSSPSRMPSPPSGVPSSAAGMPSGPPAATAPVTTGSAPTSGGATSGGSSPTAGMPAPNPLGGAPASFPLRPQPAAPGGWGAPPAPPPPAAPREPWYRREGAVTWALAVAGAVVTLAGVAMLLVLAVQQGWFGPQARVAAGAALAAVLVGLGARGGEIDRRTRSRRRVGSAPVALVATGVAAAYLDVVAMTTGYGWVPPGVGLALSGLVALGGLHLARRWDSELLAVLMVAGAALLAPVVAQDFGWVVSAYLAILCVAAWWAGGTATWPVLTFVRIVPVTASLLVGALASPPGSRDALGHLAVAAAVLLATTLTSAVSVRRDADDVMSSVAVALATSGVLACAAPLAGPGRALVLGTTAAALLLAAHALSRAPLGPVATHLVATTGAGGTVAAVLAIVSGAPDRFVTTGLLALGIAVLAVAGATHSRVTLGLGAGASLVALLAWAQHPVAVLTAGTAVSHAMAAALVDSLLVVALVAVGLWSTAAQRGLGRDLRLGATVLAWVLGLAASATAIVAVGTLLGIRFDAPVTGFTVGHACATVAWMLAAAWLLLRGLDHSRDADLTLRTGLLLSGVCVAKLFLYDLAALSGIVRSVAFIATGLLLLATGSRYARAWERRRLQAS